MNARVLVEGGMKMRNMVRRFSWSRFISWKMNRRVALTSA